MAAINASLIDTIAACGDVNRNVLASANPVESRAHAHAYEWAKRLSEHLLPRTRAYHEIWLDGEKVAGTDEAEPIYGPTYLPRKFKAAIAVPPVNDVDIFAHDLGFIAIVEQGELVGFNLTVGGGLGATHGDPTTYPRIADVVGFLKPEQLLAVAEAVVTTQRDFGNRAVRKHARLKYTIDSRGLDWFVGEITRRQGFALEPPRPFEFTSTGDRFGWVEGFDGRWHLTLRIEAGRVADTADAPRLTGLREIAKVYRGTSVSRPTRTSSSRTSRHPSGSSSTRSWCATGSIRTLATRPCGVMRLPASRSRPARSRWRKRSGTCRVSASRSSACSSATACAMSHWCCASPAVPTAAPVHTSRRWRWSARRPAATTCTWAATGAGSG